MITGETAIPMLVNELTIPIAKLWRLLLISWSWPSSTGWISSSGWLFLSKIERPGHMFATNKVNPNCLKVKGSKIRYDLYVLGWR